MSDSGAIVSLGELTKPASVLLERISDAVGGIFKPYQIVRIAKAEAEADKIRAESGIQIDDLQRRALHRFLHEEARKQANIEQITRLALPQLDTAAQPEALDNDWIANFFDKCRITSDDQLQQIWARILAGETNSPGKFSRRTVNFVASLDRSDAELFAALCSFCWVIDDTGTVLSLVFDTSHEVYTRQRVTFNTLIHLESIGLVQFESVSGFRYQRLPRTPTLSYFGHSVVLELPKEKDNAIDIGKVLLTKIGLELQPICHAKIDRAQVDREFFCYVINHFDRNKYLPDYLPESSIGRALLEFASGDRTAG